MDFRASMRVARPLWGTAVDSPVSVRQLSCPDSRPSLYTFASTGTAHQSTYKATQAMKTFLRFAFFGSLFLIPVLAHAQNGCIDSPECPTAILGLVGAAGAALYARLRSK
jgi:XrtJ-associated TM-motif-TM protein